MLPNFDLNQIIPLLDTSIILSGNEPGDTTIKTQILYQITVCLKAPDARSIRTI